MGVNAFYTPWDQNPASVAIKTSSYTIPAGQYARVTVTNLETDFTIDSVTAVEKIKYISTFAGAGTGIKYTNTSPYTLIGNIQNGGSAVALGVVTSQTLNDYMVNPIGGSDNQNTSSAATLIPALLPPDCRLNQSSSGSGTAYVDLVAKEFPVDPVFWVPTGTDLDGSRYIVELFNIAT